MQLYVRAYDRGHTLRLLKKGVNYQMRETLESAFTLGAAALEGLGVAPERIESIAENLRQQDAARLAAQQAGGLLSAGRDLFVTKAFKPEPEPSRFPSANRRHSTRKPRKRPPIRWIERLHGGNAASGRYSRTLFYWDGNSVRSTFLGRHPGGGRDPYTPAARPMAVSSLASVYGPRPSPGRRDRSTPTQAISRAPPLLVRADADDQVGAGREILLRRALTCLSVTAFTISLRLLM